MEANRENEHKENSEGETEEETYTIEKEFDLDTYDGYSMMLMICHPATAILSRVLSLLPSLNLFKLT